MDLQAQVALDLSGLAVILAAAAVSAMRLFTASTLMLGLGQALVGAGALLSPTPWTAGISFFAAVLLPGCWFGFFKPRHERVRAELDLLMQAAGQVSCPVMGTPKCCMDPDSTEYAWCLGTSRVPRQ